MKDQVLREIFLAGCDYSSVLDEWVEPMEKALSGQTAAQAIERPGGPETKGVWDIVLHMAVWNENIVERVKTGQKSVPAEGAWPRPPEHPAEMAWEDAKKRLMVSVSNLRNLIQECPMDQLITNGYGLADILCRFIHNGYHLGQIVKLRECFNPKGL